MPKQIPEMDLNITLKIPSRNIDHTRQFLEDGVEDISLYGYAVQHGYRLLKAREKNQYRLVTIGNKCETVYLAELFFRDDVVFNQANCVQIKVWRTLSSEHNAAVKDLAKLFFANLLQQYNIVVSDEEHSSDGKLFWETMIDWSFKTGYSVYASDGSEINRPLTPIQDMNAFYGRWDNFCRGTSSDVHRHRLVVISREELVQ
ncbi:hypothetical protein [Klebsiella sp. BIGb0407]|uniref:hypothetical protein n=1 Tax=Klebsiella sp. BIGb0407 TaxID=2940603 RepID=UPI002169B105|nr:hypothetical protein [Klebsiella sp. BIGb0407]MCS3433069.1 hypothetical protein [Klebsiella sp. BIGb0407]